MECKVRDWTSLDSSGEPDSATEPPASCTSEIDRQLRLACQAFAAAIGGLSGHLILREGVLKAALSELTRALEIEFDGYQDVLGLALLAQAQLIIASCAIPPV